MGRRYLNIIVTGGFEANFVAGFVRGLAANGVEQCVVSCDATAPQLEAMGIPNLNLRRNTDSRRPLLAKLTNLLRYYVALIALLFRNRGATVHYIGLFRNGLILWEGLVLNLLFRLLAGRYLYTVHNVLPHSRETSRFFRFLYRCIYRVPHVLLVHTEVARRQLTTEFGVAVEKIRLTSLGLNEEIPDPGLTRSEARSRIGFQADETLLLFFGKIDRYKGLDLLLAAFDRLSHKEVRLIIAGEFRNRAYAAEIRSQWEQMARRDDVRFFERFIPNEEVGAFFAASDALCLPYRNIYQSGLIFLAPRFGIPMIATDVGMLREFIGDTMGVVARTNDVEGIADALARLIDSPESFPARKILEQAEQLKWPNVCRNLVPLYTASPKAQGPNTPSCGPGDPVQTLFL